jgi:hypothetical protein
MKIAHVINIFKCDPNHKSYLYHALPITVNSMNRSKIKAKENNLEIELYAAYFKEDEQIIPNFFKKLPFLLKDTQKILNVDRRLPYIEEILKNLYENSDADYFIYTNADIGVKPNFYSQINKYINNGNYDSLIINRRDNIPKFINGKRLTYLDLDLINKQKGELHKGWDCFIFKRDLYKKFILKNLFIGYPPWGFILKKNLDIFSKKFKEIKNEFLTYHIGNDESWNESVINRRYDKLIINNVNNSQKIINELINLKLYKPLYNNILKNIRYETGFLY